MITSKQNNILVQLAETPIDSGEVENITSTTLMIMFGSQDIQVRKGPRNRNV